MQHAGPNHVVRVAVVAAVMVLCASSVCAQAEDVKARVATTQAVASQPAAEPLAEWETQYDEALAAAQQLQASDGTRELGEQLALDLEAYNEALRAYVRVSERLRHKDRALTASIGALKNGGQTESRVYQTMSNAMKTAHETVKNSINNIR
jgi:GGDEF domain-containing protein